MSVVVLVLTTVVGIRVVEVTVVPTRLVEVTLMTEVAVLTETLATGGTATVDVEVAVLTAETVLLMKELQKD